MKKLVMMVAAVIFSAQAGYCTGPALENLQALDDGEAGATVSANPVASPAEYFAFRETAAGTVYNIRCKYNDEEEEERVKFSLAGTYNVPGKDSATLSYRATLVAFDTTVFQSTSYLEKQPPTVIFAVGRDLKNNVKYASVKYPNHFKFALEWNGVDAMIERGNLIVSKEPVSVVKDKYGATIRTFTGALDVRYNDHHGDYVQVICTQREFE